MLISAYDLWYVLIYISESAKEFQFNMLPDIDSFIYSQNKNTTVKGHLIHYLMGKK